MSWTERPLELPTEELALRLSGLPGAFRLRDEGLEVLGALPQACSAALDPEPELELDATRPPLPRWVGLLPYEALRGAERGSARHPGGLGAAACDRRPPPLSAEIRWARYGAVVLAAPGTARVVGDDPAAVSELVRALARPAAAPQLPRLTPRGPMEPDAVHADRVRAALEHIARGDLYQVNLARRSTFSVSGHPLLVQRALGPVADAPFAAALEQEGLGVVSASPELFLDLRPDRTVRTRPIKGTRPRHADPDRDRALALELDASEKERAELAMVIDIERNDLGRLATPGSVVLERPPEVVSHATVHHREAVVRASLRPEVTRAALLEATLPSGSVTGAPKLSAMELIAELEAYRRGLYTGALGYLGHDGGLRLSMAIRVLVSRDGEAHYFAGGGIVAESEPAAEVAETNWKAAQLAALLDRGGG